MAPKVVVIGAGVIGAAVTYHLARRGARVHCVDRADRPAAGTTEVGFATATAYRRFPKAYFELNQAGIAEHAALAGDSAPWWHRTGTVAWTDDESFTGYVAQLEEWGCPVERYTADGTSVVFPASGPVAYLPSEGWIDAVAFTRHLLDQAVSLGATLELDAEVTSVSGGAGLADGRRIEADVVVNATGSAADEIGALAGARPFLGPPRRSLIAHLLVDGDPLPYILRAPEVSIRPDGPGRVVLRSDRVDRGLPPRSGTPDPEFVKDLLDRAAKVVPLLGTATVRRAEVVDARCARDELPSVGPLSAVPGYYEAVASAGVTLAPLFGKALAARIVDGEPDALVDVFTPDRFGAAAS
ncbi:NAD(P)/FAD-dependent oxidoreductase [Amycolatopsis sp. NPDC101161]|uniref:NAD(P)/FAD-dependent oxidoreductase n=1 Tax=Amycolatopsis sp. NPDC101161 TaxID=3363940 RepID=UPI00381187ED